MESIQHRSRGWSGNGIWVTKTASPAARSHLRLALLLSGSALLGKIAGFIREILFARVLGTNFIADSYRAGVTAVLLPINPLQSDIIPSVLIPLHREWSAEGRGSQMFTPLLALFGLISSLLAVLAWVLAGTWVGFIVPGFDRMAHDTTVALVRVMALGMPASVMMGWISCIEISVGRLRITTLRSPLQNVVAIVGVAVLSATGQPIFLAISFTAGFWALALVGGYLLWREGEIALDGLRLRAGLDAGSALLKRVRPLFVLPIFDQITLLVERFAGSDLGVGAIASLDYARTLTDTAMYLIGQPLGYVVLAQDALEGERVRARVEALARPLLALGLPASLYMVVFAPQIVQLAYQRGAFNAHGVMLTAAALRGIGCGLWAAMLGYVLTRILNASARNALVARAMVAGSIANVVINLFATRYLGTFGLGVGEAARGITILICAATLMGCGWMILTLILKSMPILVIFALIISGIRQLNLATLPTLLFSGSVLAIVIFWGIRTELKMLLPRLWPRRSGDDPTGRGDAPKERS
jgi:putative peptidoglycan lipid II flippase